MKNFNWLRPEELELEQRQFRGKLAGTSYKYSSHLDNLRRTRFIIFGMALVVLFPVMNNYFVAGVFSMELLIERGIFSIILITSGLLFNKVRVASMIIAMIPIAIILSAYLFVPGQFNIRTIGFLGAILVFFGLGIYHHIKAEQLKEELEKNMLEAHLIDQK